eukprot:4222639-Karenia_brevis.AAC.1
MSKVGPPWASWNLNLSWLLLSTLDEGLCDDVQSKNLPLLIEMMSGDAHHKFSMMFMRRSAMMVLHGVCVEPSCDHGSLIGIRSRSKNIII